MYFGTVHYIYLCEYVAVNEEQTLLLGDLQSICE